MVRTNVTVITIAWVAPVFQTALMSAGLIVRKPTIMRRPASAGIAMYPTASPKMTMTMAMTTLDMRSAIRVFAPAFFTRDEADIEPPTGIPWKNPTAMFAAPCPTKSREGSG
jgi:hypothetical protein